MTLAGDARQNVVEVAGKHYAPLVKFIGAAGGDVDPATVDPLTLALTASRTRCVRHQDADLPQQRGRSGARGEIHLQPFPSLGQMPAQVAEKMHR